MECKEEVVDSRNFDAQAFEVAKHNIETLFRLNHTMPMTEEYTALVRDLFAGHIGEHSMITAPFLSFFFKNVCYLVKCVPISNCNFFIKILLHQFFVVGCFQIF